MLFKSRNKVISILLTVCLLISLFGSVLPVHEVYAASGIEDAEINIDCNQINDNFIRLEQYNNLNPRGAIDSQIEDFKSYNTKMVRYFGGISNWLRDQSDINSIDMDYYDMWYNRLSQAELYADSILMPIKGWPEILSGENFNEEEFKQVLKAGIKYYKEKYGKLEYISVWNEPNHHDGTMPNGERSVATYVELYRMYDEVVKEINQEVDNGQPLKIGGPITASYHGTDWIEPFIKACAEKGYTLDFIGWNHYSGNAGAVKGHVEEVKGWITEYGFDQEKVEIIITEYGLIGGGSNFNPSSKDLLRQAAMMASSGYHYSEAGALPMHWINEHSSNYIKSQYGYNFKKSTGTNSGLEEYQFDENLQGRYVRIQGYGNLEENDDIKNLTSVKEVKVIDENGVAIPVQEVYVGQNFELIPNLYDNDLDTYWESSATWKRQITLDLGESKNISGVQIAWKDGDLRQYKFAAQVSEDNVIYHNAWDTHKIYPYGQLLKLQSMLAEERVAVTSNQAKDQGKGVRSIAAKNDDEVTALVWNYQDNGSTEYNAKIDIDNLPANLADEKLLKYEYYLVDEQHSNYAYNGDDTLYKKEYITQVAEQSVNIEFPLSRNGIAFVRVTKSNGSQDSNKNELGNKINEIMNLSQGSYTSESWEVLMEAMENGIYVYEDLEADSQQITDAWNQIDYAQSHLVDLSVEVNPKNIELMQGEISTVTANVIPPEFNQNVIWSSSDTTVAKVYDGGIIAAISPGTAIIRATSVLGNESYAEATVIVNNNSQETNVAIGKTVTATSERSTYPKENAVDGIIDKSSRWMTESSSIAPQKLEIDLGQNYQIGSARVYTGVDGTSNPSSYAIKNFRLRYLNDSSEWVDIPDAVVSDNSSQNVYFNFSNPIDTNKIEFYCLDDGTLRVLEIEVYEYDDTGVDKTTLNMKIIEGLAFDSKDYTVSTWAVFQKELNDSISISQDENASAIDVNNAAENLKTSMENLKSILLGKENIALDKSVFTNSPGGEDYPASGAVDGNIEDSGRWITNLKSVAPQWLYIDLGDTNVLGSAKVLTGSKSGSYTISDYKLQYYDGKGNIDIHDSWIDIPGAEVINNSDGENMLIFEHPIKADKIRFISELTGTLRVREIELYTASNYLELTGTEKISKGMNFDIGVDLKNVNESIYSYDFTIAYDNNLFDFISAQSNNNDIEILQQDNDSTNGVIKIKATHESGTVEGTNNLFILKFQGKEVTQNMSGNIKIDKAEAGIEITGQSIMLPTDKKMVEVLDLEHPIADTVLLKEKILEAQGMEKYKSLYTPESWAILETVLSEAISISDDVGATQEEVDEATSQLESALSNLVRITDEFDTLRLRYYEYLTGGKDFDPSDKKYADLIDDIDTTAEVNWNSMNENFVWDDLEANSTKVPGDSLTSDANKKAANQFRYMLDRLKDMALAYSTYGSKYYQDQQLKDDIIKGVDWVYTNRYNENTSYYGNWYSWQIANPETLSHIMILLYDDLTPRQIENYSAAIDYHLNHGHFDGLSASGLTGANLVNMAQNRIWNGIVAKRSDWIQEASDSLGNVLSYTALGDYNSNDADGFYTDGSFIQHAAYPYAGGYGAGFIAEISNVLWMLSGSTWEANYDDKDNIYEFIFKTYEPNIYKAIFMNPVVGRYASRREGITSAASLVKALLLQIGFSNNPYEEREKSLVKYYLQEIDNDDFNAGIWFTSKIDDIINDNSIVPRQNYTGYYQFYYQDTVAHHRLDWTLGLRMHSSRIANYESINLENLRGWYTGDGMTYLYLNDDDYGDFYLTTADQHRMPGTTVDINRNRPQSARTSREQSSKDFVGGVSFNNEYGVSAMDFQQHYEDMDLHAKKSWFMFDNEVVALGSGINSISGRTIETIIENRKLDSHNTNIFTVDGIEKSVDDGWQETINNASWAHLQGTGGYYFPEGTSIKAIREKRTNDNFVINEYLRYKGTDLFNDTLLDLMTWSFIREVKDNWSLENGHLIITTQQGSLEGTGEGTAKNLLLKEAPAGDYYMTTELDFNPQALGEEAGVIVYMDDDNYISLAKSKDMIIWKHEQDGTVVNTGNVINTDNKVFLTIEKQGEDFTLYVSDNSDTWEGEAPLAKYGLSEKVKIGLFAQGGVNDSNSNASFNEFILNHTNYHLTMWQDHDVDPVDETYSYVLLPAMEKDEVSNYANNPNIEVLANTTDVHAVREKELNLLGATFWNPGSVDYIEAQDACTVMVEEKENELTIAVSDPSQKKQTITLDIGKSAKGFISKDSEVEVLQLSPTIKVKIDVSQEPGKTFNANFALGEIPEVSQQITQSAADKFNHVILNYDSLTEGHKYYISSDVEPDQNLIDCNIFGSTRPAEYDNELISGESVERKNTEYINIVEVDKHDKVLAYAIIEVTQAPVLERDTQEYNVSADSFIRGGTESDTNYGLEEELMIKSSESDSTKRNAYFMFDYNGFTEPSAASAIFKFYVNRTSEDKNRTIKIYGTSTEWNEESIDWNNAPAPIQEDYLGSIDIDNTSDKWYEINITDYVNSKMGDRKISLILVNEGEPTAKNHFYIASKESSSGNVPKLILAEADIRDPLAKEIQDMEILIDSLSTVDIDNNIKSAIEELVSVVNKAKEVVMKVIITESEIETELADLKSARNALYEKLKVLDIIDIELSSEVLVNDDEYGININLKTISDSIYETITQGDNSQVYVKDIKIDFDTDIADFIHLHPIEDNPYYVNKDDSMNNIRILPVEDKNDALSVENPFVTMVFKQLTDVGLEDIDNFIEKIEVDLIDEAGNTKKIKYNIKVTKKALKEKINEALHKRESDFTTDSWATLQDALEEAQKVNDDSAATQEEINLALGNLITALDSLVEKVISYPDDDNEDDDNDDSNSDDDKDKIKKEKDGSVKILPPVKNNGNKGAKSIIGKETIEKALALAADIEGVKNITLDIPEVKGAEKYTLNLPTDVLTSNEMDKKLEFKTPIGSIVAAGNMFKKDEINKSTIEITIGIADKSSLSNKVKDKVGKRPVIELHAQVGGKILDWYNPDSPVTVNIEYQPTEEELKDIEHIVVWYIDDEGQISPVPNAKYNPETGKVIFTTNHFSEYAVAFNKKTFDDINIEWAKKAIEVMASKGVINGTSETTYSPLNNISRADFICLLVRTLELNTDYTSNFKDVQKDDYFYEALGVAKQLGISNGIGDNQFNPHEEISRQDMMVLIDRAIKIAGKSAESEITIDIDEFEDADYISNYALEGVTALINQGIIKGNDNKINPLGSATRAETAVMIYRIMNKYI